jgi:hypothetical protein
MSQLDFVRYVAQHAPIAPRVVFRRMKIMGAFLALGIVGVGVALWVIGSDVATSEPARLLAAFGFVVAVLVLVATVFSMGLLLWGAFIGQYVANLDRKAADAEVLDLDFEMASPAPAETNDVVIQAVTEDMKAVAEAIELAVDQSMMGTARDIRNELAAIQRRLKEMEQSLSPAGHQRMTQALRALSIRAYDIKWPRADEEQPARVAARVAVR